MTFRRVLLTCTLAFIIFGSLRATERTLLYTNSSGQLYQIQADGSGAAAFPENVGRSQYGTYDERSDYVYFLSNLGLRLIRIRPDGSELQTLFDDSGSSFSYPKSVAIDSAAGKAYWTGIEGIYRRNLDGSNKELIVPRGNTTPVDCALDLKNSKIYWTLTFGAIQRANLDGTNVEPLPDTFSSRVVALDPARGHLYYVSGNQFKRCNLDGSETIVLF